MRRLRALITGLPPDSFTWRKLAAEPAPIEAAPATPKKVDYDALRALGGEVIAVGKAD